jgi:hypothetical protein
MFENFEATLQTSMNSTRRLFDSYSELKTVRLRYLIHHKADQTFAASERYALTDSQLSEKSPMSTLQGENRECRIV